MINKVVVAGAGTMGRGIALSSALGKIDALLFDTEPSALQKAKGAIEKDLEWMVSKNKLTPDEKRLVIQRLTFTSNINDCVAPLIIEAIIEKENPKVELFTRIAGLNNEKTIFASNTSSLSITELQKQIPHPGRVAGLHFFNPAQVMKLVEVVRGELTSVDTMNELLNLCSRLNKKPVICNDSPGFIVNRVARHYYLEAMKLVESGVATIEEVDKVMESTGFKMGPFRLMDLIGMDINLAVSESIYDAFNKAPRFKPSILQIEKVRNKELGRKSNKGFYDYPQ